MKAVDLHTHSTKSDGSATPTELVELAVSKGLKAIALTDHDSIEGIQEARAAALAYPDFTLIPGIELSTEYHGKDIHMVGLFIDETNPDFLEHLARFRNSRVNRNIEMCQNLQEAGIDITFEKLQDSFPGSVITRAHYALYLIEHGYVGDKNEAFDRYLGDHTKYFVPRKKITPVDGIELIQRAGGIAILAHPTLYHFGKDALEELVALLKENGLAGMECVYATYTPAQEREMKRLADKYHLKYSGGSDFHGNAKPGLELGTGYGKLFVPESILTDLSSPKVFFSDIDGTLIRNDKTISAKLSDKLRRFHEAGHILCLTSGRPIKSIRDKSHSLGIDFPGSYIISYNGGLLYDCDQAKPLYENCLSMGDVSLIMECARAHAIHCHCYENDLIITEHDSEELAYYRRNIHLDYRVVPQIDTTLSKTPYKLIAIALGDGAHEKLIKLQKEVLEKAKDRITAVFSNANYLEFFPSDSGKGNALRKLCQILSIPLSSCAAAGDEANDISMLEAAGVGYAMQNATDLVKKSADRVTQNTNNEDGIEEILSDFFGIN